MAIINWLLRGSLASKFVKIIRSRLQASHEDIDYEAGKVLIKLPHYHMLPRYKAAHPRYDSFLPCLASVMPSGAVVIDVGSNCGDTMAAMARENCELEFFCVEADSEFFKYLTSNLERMRRALGPVNVKTANVFAGQNIFSCYLAGSGGTKHAVAVASGDPNALKSQSLDSLANSYALQLDSVLLLKVDTDGFDYDVIQSASNILRGAQPMVFFECQIDTYEQKLQYFDLFEFLSNLGYREWALFDNFGGLITKTPDVSQVKNFIDYMFEQLEGRSTRTMYYLDILVSTAKSSTLFSESLSAYLNAADIAR